MKNTFQSILLLIGLLFFQSCHSDKKTNSNAGEPLVINVTVNDSLYQDIDKNLSLSKLIRLDSEPMLTSIKRFRFANKRIYLTDETARLFCYDMDGKFIYKIDAQGNGPGEYSDISFFTINEEKKEIAVYDNMRAALLFYDMDEGKFLRNEQLRKPNPTDACFNNGYYYYDNRYHYNYPNDKDLHYSLLLSLDGVNVSQSYFPHDEAEHEFSFTPSATRFYLSDSLLLYCKDFDNVVYELCADDIKERYRFDISGMLSKEQIEKKIDIVELLRSDYAYGISDIYECDGILSFRFTQKGFVLSALYDLRSNELIYCGKALLEKPCDKVPLIGAIVGVYDANFVSVLSPEYIDFHKKKTPDLINKLLPDYDSESDNPVIALYSVIP